MATEPFDFVGDPGGHFLMVLRHLFRCNPQAGRNEMSLEILSGLQILVLFVLDPCVGCGDVCAGPSVLIPFIIADLNLKGSP